MTNNYILSQLDFIELVETFIEDEKNGNTRIPFEDWLRFQKEYLKKNLKIKKQINKKSD